MEEMEIRVEVEKNGREYSEVEKNFIQTITLHYHTLQSFPSVGDEIVLNVQDDTPLAGIAIHDAAVLRIERRRFIEHGNVMTILFGVSLDMGQSRISPNVGLA